MAIEEALGLQIIFIAGIANVIFLLLILASCRCTVLWKFSRDFLKYEKYKKFYNLHCYYWYGFIISILIHTIVAFYLFGWPF